MARIKVAKLFCVAFFNAFDYILTSAWNRKYVIICLFPLSITAFMSCLIMYQTSFSFIYYFIISLDIIFFLTTLFLIMYHVFKEPEFLLLKIN